MPRVPLGAVMAEASYRLWVNEARTLLVRQWDDGQVEIAERDHPNMTWGPPVQSQKLPSWIGNLIEEKAQ
jgi:hypothetical protein